MLTDKVLHQAVASASTTQGVHERKDNGSSHLDPGISNVRVAQVEAH